MPEIQHVPLGQVFENPWNPNVVPDALMAALIENIRRTGFTQPILVREREGRDGYEVVDGAHRFRAACELQMETVPVVVTDLSDAEAKAQTLAMNKLRGEMEPAEVARLIREIDEDGLKMDELATFTGYTLDELEGLDKLLDFNWDDFGSTPPPDPSGSDDEWVTLSYRVPEAVAGIFQEQVERFKGILETEHDHLAIELIAVNASQSSAAEMMGEGH